MIGKKFWNSKAYFGALLTILAFILWTVSGVL